MPQLKISSQEKIFNKYFPVKNKKIYKSFSNNIEEL